MFLVKVNGEQRIKCIPENSNENHKLSPCIECVYCLLRGIYMDDCSESDLCDAF